MTRGRAIACRGLALGALAATGAIALFACGEVTVVPDASSTTSSGQGAACPTGQADCGGDGHCDELDTLDACGACGAVCSTNNATASCTSGRCVLACDAGFADCNGDPSDGCEVELGADPEHCASCDASCGAESDCFQGTCVSILASAPAALVGADSFVTFGADLYWGSPGVNAVGEIASVPMAGGPVTPRTTAVGWPERLHSNGQWLVFSDVTKPGLYRMALPSGPVETVLTASGAAPKLLEVVGTQVYFTTGSDIERVGLMGGAPVVLASGFVDVSAARAWGAYLYVADLGPEIDQPFGDVVVAGHPEGTLSRLTFASGLVEPLLDHLDSPVAVAPTDDALYWAESGSMATFAVGSANENAGSLGRIGRSSLDGSARSVLADQLIQPVDLAVDGATVYFASAGTVGGLDPQSFGYEPDGKLARVPTTGGAIETVMPSIDARNLLVTKDAIFFASWNLGLVFRKAKP